MPTSSDQQRALMAKWFPTFDGPDGPTTPNDSGIADGPPIRFLIRRGWDLDNGGMWSKPTPSYNPSIYEIECLLFLRDEWDYDFHKPIFPEV